MVSKRMPLGDVDVADMLLSRRQPSPRSARAHHRPGMCRAERRYSAASSAAVEPCPRILRLVHHAGEIERVPVGQADAAVRLGLADLFGLG